jgi:hypothetical protein
MYHWWHNIIDYLLSNELCLKCDKGRYMYIDILRVHNHRIEICLEKQRRPWSAQRQIVKVRKDINNAQRKKEIFPLYIIFNMV